jgi:hypothetical protein
MGRGRAKAKQTKVARELKYQTLATDFSALQRELGSPGKPEDDADDELDGEYDDDRYAAYADLQDDGGGRQDDVAEPGSTRR